MRLSLLEEEEVVGDLFLLLGTKVVAVYIGVEGVSLLSVIVDGGGVTKFTAFTAALSPEIAPAPGFGRSRT